MCTGGVETSRKVVPGIPIMSPEDLYTPKGLFLLIFREKQTSVAEERRVSMSFHLGNPSRWSSPTNKKRSVFLYLF